jgi:hypothetical protein
MAVVLEWVETGQVFPLPLGRPVVIGRGPQAAIALHDYRVSRRHCEARWDGCRVWVQDLGGRWGTTIEGDRFLGGIRVIGHETVLLRLGDVLHLAGVVRLRLGTPSRVEAAWLAWQGGLVEAMARQADESADYGGLPVLADALEEAGCADADLLAHCRSGGGHLRGCWAVDLLLGRS